MLPRPIHFQVTYVKAKAAGGGRLGKSSAYIRRCFEEELARTFTAHGYMTRSGSSAFEGETDVAAIRFFCRGSHTSKKTWAAVDKAFRTKAGDYSKRGGTPRLALFIDATLPYELSEQQKLQVGHELAEAFVTKYGVCVEAAWHTKHGVIDHVHLLVSTRVVDEDGVGPIVRDFNGIASKCTSPVIDGKKRLAGHMEWMRGTYADLLTRETGVQFDPTSYERQGNGKKPVPYVSRKVIEEDKEERWKESRRQLIASRDPILVEPLGGTPSQPHAGAREADLIASSALASLSSQTKEQSSAPAEPTIQTASATFQSMPDRSPSMASDPAALLLKLAIAVESHARAPDNMHSSRSRDRRDEKDRTDADRWRQVDEENRADAAAEIARREAERKVAAQKVHDVFPHEWLLPPPQTSSSSRPGKRSFFENSDARKRALQAAQNADRFAVMRRGSSQSKPGRNAGAMKLMIDAQTTPMPSAQAETATRSASKDLFERPAEVAPEQLAWSAPADSINANFAKTSPKDESKPDIPSCRPSIARPSGLLPVLDNEIVRISSATTPSSRTKDRPELASNAVSSSTVLAAAAVQVTPTPPKLPEHVCATYPIRKIEAQLGHPTTAGIRRLDDRGNTNRSKDDADRRPPRSAQASPDLIVRLASVIQAFGPLAIYTDALAARAGLDKRSFDKAVTAHSAATIMSKIDFRSQQPKVLQEIEESGDSELLTLAVKALKASQGTQGRRFVFGQQTKIVDEPGR